MVEPGAGGNGVAAEAQAAGTAAKPGRKYSRAYRKSGFYTMASKLSQDGLSALDGRSSQARALRVWKAQVAADLGGDLSSQELTLLEVAAVDMALLTVADTWLREHAAEVVNKRKRTFVPLVRERLAVASHLAELLKLLGTKRKARSLPSLRSYIAERQDAGQGDGRGKVEASAPEAPAAP